MGRLVWKIWTSIYLCSFQFSLEATSFFLWKAFLDKNNYFSFSDVNVAVRKIANLLKPDKEILQNGDHMIIKTLSTFRNYIMEFDVGKEFEEDLSGVDDRKCMVRSRTSAMDKMNIDNLSQSTSFNHPSDYSWNYFCTSQFAKRYLQFWEC